MSFNFVVHSINNSFAQMLAWFKEFMARTEQAFHGFHQRLVYLERRLDISDRTALTDEQVERVLRKVLAERFSPNTMSAGNQSTDNGPDPRTHKLPADAPAGGAFVINIRDEFVPPRPVDMDIAKLAVDPEAVPNQAWREDMRILEEGLPRYPAHETNKRSKSNPSRSTVSTMSSIGSHGVNPHPPTKVHGNNAWS